MQEGARKYLGKSNIGTNQYDTGECVGLYNKVVQDVTGILYPIQGAQGAKDLITAKNTRPDLFQQIKNNPNDPNQLPQVNDWVVWGSTWGGGWGHVACVVSSDANSFTSIEQNFVYHKVTEQWHDYKGVIGWIRYTPPAPVNPCAGVKNELAAAQTTINQQKSQIDQLNAQVKTLTDANTKLTKQVTDLTAINTQLLEQNASQALQITELNSQIEELNKQLKDANKKIADLEAQLASCSGNTDITINFNNFGQILWVILKAFGINKKGK